MTYTYKGFKITRWATGYLAEKDNHTVFANGLEKVYEIIDRIKN